VASLSFGLASSILAPSAPAVAVACSAAPLDGTGRTVSWFVVHVRAVAF
jgi:hypothetical protein